VRSEFCENFLPIEEFHPTVEDVFTQSQSRGDRADRDRDRAASPESVRSQTRPGRSVEDRDESLQLLS
jgi:hypothetical protein